MTHGDEFPRAPITAEEVEAIATQVAWWCGALHDDGTLATENERDAAADRGVALEAEVTALRAERDAMERTRSSAQQQRDTGAAHLDAANAEMVKRTAERDRLTDLCHRMEEEAKRHEREITVHRQRADALAKELEAARAEVRAARGKALEEAAAFIQQADGNGDKRTGWHWADRIRAELLATSAGSAT
jgi:chromosome segregation ATPase